MNNRPRRRKSNDNPYTLQIINNTYVVIFKDGKNREQVVEVSEDIFNQMDKFELEDLKELNEYDRHIEHSEIYDETLYKRAINKLNNTDEIVEKKLMCEKLYYAINQLSEKQKRRIKMYFFEDKKLCEIAELEHCAIGSVEDSINNGIKKIKEILNI